jgi:hypothetical protein
LVEIVKSISDNTIHPEKDTTWLEMQFYRGVSSSYIQAAVKRELVPIVLAQNDYIGKDKLQQILKSLNGEYSTKGLEDFLDLYI